MMDVNTTRTHNDAMQAACKIMNLPQNNKYAVNKLLMSHWSGNVFPKVDEWALTLLCPLMIMLLPSGLNSTQAMHPTSFLVHLLPRRHPDSSQLQ
jgi:hypothetical protein